MITAVTSSATVAWRLFRQKCASLRCLSPRPAGQSASGQDVRATPLGSATRRGQAPGWARSGQPWRAFQRGFRLLSTNTLRPRRTTTDPAFCFNARSEFLAFIVRRPFGPSSLLLQVVEAATIFFRSKFPAWQDPCDQSRHGATGTVRLAAAWRDADGTVQALRPLPLMPRSGRSRISRPGPRIMARGGGGVFRPAAR